MGTLKQILFFMLIIAMVGCGGSKNQGVEAGNPPTSTTTPVQKQVTIVPETGNENYVTSFSDEDTAVVSQVSKTGPASLVSAAAKGQLSNVLETVTVSYSISGTSVVFSASFSNGTTIQVTLTFNLSGTVNVGLLINGQPVNATASVAQATQANTQALQNGLDQLKTRNLSNAKTTFCSELPQQPTNSRLAFGCFWSKMMLLPETPEASRLLGIFNQPNYLVQTQMLGSNGIFARRNLIQAGSRFEHTNFRFPKFNYADFDLPFAGFFKAREQEKTAQVITDLLDAAVSNNLNATDIQDQVFDLLGPLSELEQLLAIVLSDTSFTFTLPKELYYLNTDLLVTYKDVQLFMAAVEGSIVGIHFLSAYDLGINIDHITRNGDIDDAVLVQDLNGTGAAVNGVTVDTIAFLTLTNASLITSSKARLLAGLELQKSAIQKMIQGETSAFVTPIRGVNLNAWLLRIDQFISSINNGTTQMQLGGRTLFLDLRSFFANPPSATQTPVTAGDGFVLENGKAKPVENYFRQFLGQAVDF